ncbi:GumC family protein [Persicobacter psychrovividus]|uniref:non-specific protein-tyrosine kinase n=1 Tax=Persicobacter psychrovividus TaxID=387638 RepID=A0ABN6LFA2_9BACT|nr:sugar transporter [Persicobacter psychrovividus]
MGSIIKGEKLNVTALISAALSRWYLFAISIIGCLATAFYVVYTSPMVFEISAKVLVSDDNSKAGPEDFMKGMELFATDTELEDEIGLLSSYTLINKALMRLDDFDVSYYQGNQLKKRELYKTSPFSVEFDNSKLQLAQNFINFKVISNTEIQVFFDIDKGPLYNLESQKKITKVEDIQEDKLLPLNQWYRTDYLNFKVSFLEEDLSDYIGETFAFKINPLHKMTKTYVNKLDISPISKESSIVEIALRGSTPEKEVEFVNMLIQVYLESDLNKKNELGLQTIKFIDGQLAGVSDSLKSVEKSLENFRADNEILDITTTSTNLYTKLDRLETEQGELKAKLKYYQYVYDYLNASAKDFQDIVAPSSIGVDDPLLTNLLIELSQLNQERAALGYSTKNSNPITQQFDAKITNAKAAVKENVNNIINTTKFAVSDINKRLAEIKKTLNKLPSNERALVNIQRQFNINDNIYNYLLEKRAEAGIAIASNTSNKTIVDQAMLKSDFPVAPKPKITYLLALFFGILLPLIAIVVLDAINDNIISKQQLEQLTEIPILGMVPNGSKVHQKAVAITHYKPETVLAEAFRSIRVNLQYLTFKEEHKVMGVTSSISGEGKTFCSLNLSIVLAQSGKKTVLVESDLRRPKISTYWENSHFKTDKGLSSYLVGQHNTKSIIQKSEVENLDIIVAGPTPPNPIDLISSVRMNELIQELRKTYDFIILDTPPLTFVSEYIILKELVDNTVYVVRSNYTKQTLLNNINELYQKKQINNISILLNCVKEGMFSSDKYKSYAASYSNTYKNKNSKKITSKA